MTFEQRQLLREAADRAVEDYKHFDMAVWRFKVTKKIKESWKNKQQTKTALECGTVCCLAGNICAVKLGVRAFEYVDKDSVQEIATTLTGLSPHEAGELFSPAGIYYTGTPYKPGTLKYAKAIRAGVEKFLLEKGAE